MQQFNYPKLNPDFNANIVLSFIKYHLGYPNNIIELSDDFIIDNIILHPHYLVEFSKYCPKEERIYLTADNNELEELKVMRKKNPELFDGINIARGNNLNLDNVNTRMHNRWILNSQNIIIGIKSVDYLRAGSIYELFYNGYYNYGNHVDQASMNLMHAMNDVVMTHKFYPPNIVEVQGFPRYYKLMATIEVSHDKDLSSIPPNIRDIFMKFCLYTTASYLLGIRSKYSNLSTTIGEISLNLDFLSNLAEKKNELYASLRHVGNFNSRGLGIVVV